MYFVKKAMKPILKYKTNWLARVFFILVSFFVFQSSIVSALAHPINLRLNPHDPTFQTHVYDEIESSIRVESRYSDRVNWVLSKREVRVISEILVDESKVAAKGATNLIPKGKLANHLFKGTGKLVDNPANRSLISKISNGKPLVADKFGKSWYRGVDASGKGIYSYTQNGVVKGAGYTNLSAAEIIAKYGVR